MEYGNLPIIDWTESLRLVGNQTKIAEDLLALLIKSLPNDLTNIKNLHHEKNYPGLLFAIHKLNGALCYCGLPRLNSLGRRLETQLKTNIMDDLPSLIELLDIEVKQLIEHYSYQV
jgi:two-component system sensor histidine kinase BarA